jgi:hypothetical protein
MTHRDVFVIDSIVCAMKRGDIDTLDQMFAEGHIIVNNNLMMEAVHYNRNSCTVIEWIVKKGGIPSQYVLNQASAERNIEAIEFLTKNSRSIPTNDSVGHVI